MNKREKIFKKEIRLSGSGGQGLITAGIILARAAVNNDYRVTQTQSYGPESRGGASRADVLISDHELHFPEAVSFDVLLTLTQKSCDKYSCDLKENGILISDSTFVNNITTMSDNIYELPFTEITNEKLGTELPTNIVALSFLVKITKIVTEASLKEAVISSVKPAYVDLNTKAIKLGFKLAEDYKKA